MQHWDIYFITSQDLSRGRNTIDVVKAAVEAGVDVVQLREKHMEGKELLQLGMQVREITLKHGVQFIVNDRVDIAVLCDADGVHLGQKDIPFMYARSILKKDKIIGISAENLEQALQAEKDGASYVGVGPIFNTMSKSDAAPQVGLQNLKTISKSIGIPVVAVGGINHLNAHQVIANGAHCISLISAISQADDIYGSVKSLKEIIKKAKMGVNS
ncbi:MAG: thiamine phosphate synthase [Bacillota bacterium]